MGFCGDFCISGHIGHAQVLSIHGEIPLEFNKLDLTRTLINVTNWSHNLPVEGFYRNTTCPSQNVVVHDVKRPLSCHERVTILEGWGWNPMLLLDNPSNQCPRTGLVSGNVLLPPWLVTQPTLVISVLYAHAHIWCPLVRAVFASHNIFGIFRKGILFQR